MSEAVFFEHSQWNPRRYRPHLVVFPELVMACELPKFALGAVVATD
jgi:hypothetical protein